MRCLNKIIFLIALLPPCAFCSAEDKAAQPDMPNVLGGIVRSDEWVIRREKGEEEFTGHVSYKNPAYEIKSDWALAQKKQNIVKLRGNVWGKKLEKGGAYSEAFSHTGIYNRKTGTAELYPRNDAEQVHTVHISTMQGRWDAFSDAAFFYEPQSLVEFRGRVNIKGQDASSLSEKALYNYKTAVFELLGLPVIWGTHNGYDFAVRGSSATVNNFYSDVTIHGRVTGWVRNPEEYAKHGTKIGKH